MVVIPSFTNPVLTPNRGGYKKVASSLIQALNPSFGVFGNGINRILVKTYIADSKAKNDVLIKQLSNKDFVNLSLTKPIMVSQVRELDYTILSNDELNVFGYGPTFIDALESLEADLVGLKEDVESKLINNENSDSDYVDLLKDIFGYDN